MLEMAYEVWCKKEKIEEQEIKIGVGVYCIVMASIMVLTMISGDAWISFVIAIVIGLLFGKWFYKNRKTEHNMRKLIFVLIAETIVMYVIAMGNCLGTVMLHYGEQISDFEMLEEEFPDNAYREKMDATTNLVELQWEEFIQNLQMEDLSVEGLKYLYSFLTDSGHLSIMNEESVYGLHAMTLFNTFNNSNLSEFYKKIGGEGSSNYVGYFGENSFMDMLLGVKYYYNRSGKPNSFAYKFLKKVGDVSLYENQYALSLGYVIPESLWLEEKLLFQNPFQTMNQMSQNIVGEDVYSMRKFTLEEVNGCSIENFTGTYGYFTEFDRGKAQVLLSYEAKEEENLVIQLCNQEMYLAEIFVNGQSIVKGEIHRQVVDLGMLQENDTVKIVINFSKEYDKAGMYLYAGAFYQDVMCQVYEQLVEEQMNVTSFEEDCITGTIHILKSEDKKPVLLTIPYKSGWNFYVDGELIEIQEDHLWGGVFPVLELASGEHEIVCSYVSPMFHLGLYISIISFGAYAIQCFVKKYCYKIIK